MSSIGAGARIQLWFYLVFLAGHIVFGGQSAAVAAGLGDRVGMGVGMGLPVELSGVLRLRSADDFVHHRAQLLYFLEVEGTQREVELRFSAGAPAALQSGQRATVRGILASATVLVVAADGLRLPDAPDAPDALDAASAGAPQSLAMTGARSAAVLLVNFTDASFGVGCTIPIAAGNMFTNADSADQRYREMSFGQLSFPADTNGDTQPDVFGPYTIGDAVGEGCDLGLWARDAETMAQAAGVNLALYQHRVLVFPYAAAAVCNQFIGFGDIGCPGSCRAWIFNCGQTALFEHELGHNLGLYHATADADNDGAIDAGFQYGDTSDSMGECCWGNQFSAPHKDQLGWLDAAHVQDLTQSGVWTLDAEEMDPATAIYPQALRIGDFYLSTRQAIGSDLAIDHGLQYGLRQDFTGRTSVHRYDHVNNPQYLTLLAATLGDGDSFTDGGAGFTASQVSHTANSVTLNVTVFPPQLSLFTVAPCRAYDSRAAMPLYSWGEQTFANSDALGKCGVPFSARAVAINVTAVAATSAGALDLYAGNIADPYAAGQGVVSFNANQSVGNNAILSLAPNGSFKATARLTGTGTQSTHFLLDVSGYYQ